MTPEDANREAHRWVGFTRSLARRPPPTYSQEDWEAEALFALARALRDFEARPGRFPMGRFVPYLRKVVARHLADCRDALDRTPSGQGPPRVTFAQTLSMEAPIGDTMDPDEASLHDIVANTGSPDPYDAFVAKELMTAIRGTFPHLDPDHREALGYLLVGLTPTQVARLTGRTEQAEADRRLRVRRILDLMLRQRGLGGLT